jgi:glutamate synthase (NADPH/NADH) small chain
MEYLSRQNRLLAGEIEERELLNARDKVVLVIGGGDTGADCVGTANRQGAKKIYQYEILPRPREWREDWNPEWPDWPGILRTGSSHEEGVTRDWAVNTLRFSGRDVKVEQGLFARVEWNKDAAGRWVMQEVPDSQFTLAVDMVILGMGFLHPKHSRLLKDLEVAFDPRGNIRTDSVYATSAPGVFAAGDAATGASLVVRAIWHGRQAAACIHRYLESI